jgi:ATP-dependent exoDNAse (exonuclease V) beta subunit
LGYTKNVLPIYKQALLQQNIPTNSHDPVLLLDHPIIQTAWHILNYLSDVEANHFDKISQVGILRNPIFNFTESFIDVLVKSREDNIFFEQTIDLFASQNDKTNWLKLTGFLKKWQEQSSKILLAELFQKIMDDIKSDMSAHEMMLCEDFYQLLLIWQKQDLSTLRLAKAFLKNLPHQDITATFSQNNSIGVRMMSIHAAKGLEFDHVFLVPGKHRNNESPLFFYKTDHGFLFKTHDAGKAKTLKYQLEETENFILEKSEKSLKEKEELARLVYVALTRVRKKLYIFCDKPTQTLLKALKENPDDVSALKSYNDWLYYALSNFSCSALR